MVDKPMGKQGNGFASRICQWASSFGKESEGQPTFFRRLKASIPFQVRNGLRFLIFINHRDNRVSPEKAEKY